ncbi:MAG TPA: phenylalanine--tRNA ligase subunit beta, partial [Myxococcales bacterium]|nr:phenylalanine--tRNA ligase subunit beta [Myxococcales bacterium]
VESDGMLCSERELGLSEDHSGLMQLPRDARIGAPLDELLGLPDLVFEVNVTPNRPDALSHLGIARELSALTGVAVRQPATQAPGAGELPARVAIDDAQRCARFYARVIEGVRIGPSPLWVQERLRACGVRPISNVVDATNLVLLELGHPLHGYDLDQVAGHQLIARRAREGEQLKTLDGKDRTLSADDLVIADAERAVGLAGVMGGSSSEVSDQTTRILLECAMFEPGGIRRTARRHALHTEASHRFERGMDERTAGLAADRCAELIVQLAGGKLLPGALDAYPAPRERHPISVRPSRVSAILGVEVPDAEVDRWLRALQLVPSGDGRWVVPSWRRDLTREIDLIEEIARLRGYDTIPVVLHQAGQGETAAIPPQLKAELAVRASLEADGFDEAVNYSFGPVKDMPGPAVLVANPLTAEQGAMRTVMLDGLLRNLVHNFARGAHEVRLYELGRVYLPEPDPRHAEGDLAWPVHEPRRLGLVISGAVRKGVHTPQRPLDYFDLKGAVQDLLESLRLREVAFVPQDHHVLHPVSSTTLNVHGIYAGILGQLHPRTARHFDLPEDTFVAELEWEVLLKHAVAVPQAHGVPRFPALARDMAFVVKRDVPAARMLAEIRGADAKGLLEEVELFDSYDAEPYRSKGQRSLAFRLSLRAADRTLTDAEADALCASIRDRLKSQLAAELRA